MQTEMTLNLLRQPTLKTVTWAWEYFNGPSSYDHVLNRTPTV